MSHAKRELLRRAVWLSTLYGLAHLFGLREWTSALLAGPTCSLLERIGCCVYLFLYVSFVLVVPTLVIATLLLIIWETFGRAVHPPRPRSERRLG